MSAWALSLGGLREGRETPKLGDRFFLGGQGMFWETVAFPVQPLPEQEA